MNRKLAALAAASLTTAATLTGAAYAASAGATSTHTTASVPVRWASLATSSTPKQVILDALTGKVLSVEATTAASPAAITVHNPCQSGDACWVHNAIPYADFGFAGTGTKTGTWTQRNAMYTHSHSTSVCWAQSPNCSPRFGPNTVIGFSSYPVTGTKVTNYS